MELSERFGLSRKSYFYAALNIIELVGLCVVGIATTFAISETVWEMLSARKVDLSDLLLLFLFLEVLDMVGQYFKTGHVQVRYPIYIAIVALARLLILQSKSMGQWEILSLAGTIVLLTIAVLILRYSQFRHPNQDDDPI